MTTMKMFTRLLVVLAMICLAVSQELTLQSQDLQAAFVHTEQQMRNRRLCLSQYLQSHEALEKDFVREDDHDRGMTEKDVSLLKELEAIGRRSTEDMRGLTEALARQSSETLRQTQQDLDHEEKKMFLLKRRQWLTRVKLNRAKRQAAAMHQATLQHAETLAREAEVTLVKAERLDGLTRMMDEATMMVLDRQARRWWSRLWGWHRLCTSFCGYQNTLEAATPSGNRPAPEDEPDRETVLSQGSVGVAGLKDDMGHECLADCFDHEGHEACVCHEDQENYISHESHEGHVCHKEYVRYEDGGENVDHDGPKEKGNNEDQKENEEYNQDQKENKDREGHEAHEDHGGREGKEDHEGRDEDEGREADEVNESREKHGHGDHDCTSRASSRGWTKRSFRWAAWLHFAASLVVVTARINDRLQRFRRRRRRRRQ